MRLAIFSFLIVTIIQSCSNSSQQREPFKSMLENCDEVNINFYNGGDTIKFDTQDSLGIEVLSQSVSGNTENINDACPPAGQLFYRAGSDTLLRAEFAVLPNGNKNECSFITYSHQGKSYKNRLHDKAHQLLTQIYPKPSIDSTSTPADTTAL